jgi:hypothetical protein
MSHEEKPAIEQDAKIARVLGAVAVVVMGMFGFYIGTIGGKDWVKDYQPFDMLPGYRGAAYGIIIALVVNVVIYVNYRKTLDKDSVGEWYDPQSGHGHH